MVPEQALPRILQELGRHTDDNAARRKLAVRWFNRLYYEVRHWNEEFLAFLKTFPESETEDAKSFLQRLKEYQAALHGEWSPVKKDLCSNLRILNAKLATDFAWMREGDTEWDYNQIRKIVSDAFEDEMGVIGCALEICNQIDWIFQDRGDTKAGRKDIVDTISRYASESQDIVNEIDRLSTELGFHLLSITEYEDALQTQGSANPEIMVIGEIMNETYNIKNLGGVVNIKSKLHNVVQTISAGTCLPKQSQDELSQLIAQLQSELERIADTEPRAVKRITTSLEQITDEISADEPDKGWLQDTLDTFNKAVTTVRDIAPKVLDIGAKIAAIVSPALS